MRGTAGKIKNLYQHFQGFIIDIEGVLIKGEQLIPPALKAIETLMASKKKLVFLSNISDLTREEVAGKLGKHGFDVAPAQILTSAYASVLYLKERYPGKRKLFLIGTPSFKKELTDNGFIVTGDGKKADAVVVGLDYELNYEKICEAAKAIRNGKRFIASNLAKIKLTDDDYTIGPGFTVRGLEFAAGRQAELVGKPSTFMFEQAISYLDLSPHSVLTVGDKLEQDIYGGSAIGTATCLVLSGAAARVDILRAKDNYKLDYMVEDISGLLDLQTGLHI